MTREQQIAAEVAARYGVKVQPAAVQVVPTGASAWALPVWDGKMLRYPDADKRKAAVQAAHYRRAKMGAMARASQESPRMTALQERREAVRILHAEGLWQSEMARRLCVNVSTISTDHQALGLEPVKPPKEAFNNKRAYEVPPQIVARNARIAELAAQGMTADKIGLDVGFSPRVVLDVARKLGVEVKRLGRPTKAEQLANAQAKAKAKALVRSERRVRLKAERYSESRQFKVEERRAEVKRLIDAGHYTAEIARILNISQRIASLDVRAVGGGAVSGIRGPRRSGEREARRDLVMALHRQGLSDVEISARVGVHHDTVRLDLRALGVIGMSVEESRVMAVAALRSARVQREADMVRLSREGLSLAAITLRLKISESTVRRVLIRHGLMPDRPGMIEARRNEVYRMRMAGATLAQMVDALGVAETTISCDLRALGLADRREGTAARRAEVAKMRAAGLTIPQMAEALCVSHSTISVDISALGLVGKAADAMDEAA